MAVKTYRAEELILKSVADNGGMTFTRQDKGVLKGKFDTRMLRHITNTESRECLANYMPELSDVTFVTIPSVDEDGEDVDPINYPTLMWEAASGGCLVATMSGEKSGNYIRLSKEQHAWLSSFYVDGQGVPFVQAVGLLFSSMTANTGQLVDVRIITKGHPLDQQQDGTGLAPVGCGVQIRATHAVGDGDGYALIPDIIGKGTVIPNSRDGWWYLHHTQLKGNIPDEMLVYNGQEVELKMWVLMNMGNTSEKVCRMANGETVYRKRMSWMSSEVTALFKNSRAVRRQACKRTSEATETLISLFTEERRVDLLERLGDLEIDLDTMSLLDSRTSAGEYLRTGLPMSGEGESLLGRFAVPEITQIAFGCGIRVHASLLIVNAKYGEDSISEAMARQLVELGQPVWGLYRVPVTGAQAIVWFVGKSPYKKGKGFVVTPKVAKLLDGDGDGDIAFLISGADAAWVLGAIDYRFGGTEKPGKNKKAPINTDTRSIMEYMIDLTADHGLVGRATMLGWRAMRDNVVDDAVNAMKLANAAPMLMKHDVSIDGRNLHDLMDDLVASEKARSPKEIDENGNEKAIIAPLNWRQFKEWSKTKDTFRQLSGWYRRPESVLDSSVNAACNTIRRWDASNPVKALTMGAISRVTFGMQGVSFPGWAVREAAQIRETWSEYWKAHSHKDEKGNSVLDAGDHSRIYDQVRAWGASAHVLALRALVSHERRQGESMGLKWTAVFDTRRGVEVLGFHPEVERRIEWKKSWIAAGKPKR